MLLVEPDPDAAVRIQELVSKSIETSVYLVCVHSLAHALDKLAERKFDIVLLEPDLPDSQGEESIRKTCAGAGKIPLIVLTGSEKACSPADMPEGNKIRYFVKGKMTVQELGRVVMDFAVGH